MTNRVYKGSLLSQKILSNQNMVDQTVLKEERLPILSPRHKRLSIIHSVAKVLGIFVLYHFIALSILTVFFVSLPKWNDNVPIVTDSDATSLSRAFQSLWLDKRPFQFNVAMLVLGIFSFCLVIWTEWQIRTAQRESNWIINK